MCSRTKYLGIHVLAGKNVKMDLTAAKGKYYGCFNSILSICGKQRNEITTLHLVKTYCLPRLLYMLVKSCLLAVCKHVNCMLCGTVLFDVYLIATGGKV